MPFFFKTDLLVAGRTNEPNKVMRVKSKLIQINAKLARSVDNLQITVLLMRENVVKQNGYKLIEREV